VERPICFELPMSCIAAEFPAEPGKWPVLDMLSDSPN